MAIEGASPVVRRRAGSVSHGAVAPYRAGRGTETASLVVRYGCVTSWVALGAPFIVAAALTWVLSTESFTTASHVTPCALSLLALAVFSSVPLVILRARVEGGHLVVSGRRWPGRQTTWSCTLADATRFEEQTFQKALVPGAPSKVLYYRRVALRTRDDRVLGLTHAAYPSARWPHSSVVARLNAWLATQTDACG